MATKNKKEFTIAGTGEHAGATRNMLDVKKGEKIKISAINAKVEQLKEQKEKEAKQKGVPLSKITYSPSKLKIIKRLYSAKTLIKLGHKRAQKGK